MKRPYTSPGEILMREYIKPYGLTQKTLSEHIKVGVKIISEIYKGKREISPLIALKLAKFLGTTPEFWLNLQNQYSLYKAYEKYKNKIDTINCVNNYYKSIYN